MDVHFARDVYGRAAVLCEHLERYFTLQLELGGVKKAKNLSFAQLYILVQLHRHTEPLRCHTLKRHGYAGTNISYNLTKLEDAGYLSRKRNGEDQREVFIKLTAKGTELAKPIALALNAAEEALGEHFPEEQFKAFMHKLSELEASAPLRLAEISH